MVMMSLSHYFGRRNNNNMLLVLLPLQLLLFTAVCTADGASRRPYHSRRSIQTTEFHNDFVASEWRQKGKEKGGDREPLPPTTNVFYAPAPAAVIPTKAPLAWRPTEYYDTSENTNTNNSGGGFDDTEAIGNTTPPPPDTNLSPSPIAAATDTPIATTTMNTDRVPEPSSAPVVATSTTDVEEEASEEVLILGADGDGDAVSDSIAFEQRCGSPENLPVEAGPLATQVIEFRYEMNVVDAASAIDNSENATDAVGVQSTEDIVEEAVRGMEASLHSLLVEDYLTCNFASTSSSFHVYSLSSEPLDALVSSSSSSSSCVEEAPAGETCYVVNAGFTPQYFYVTRRQRQRRQLLTDQALAESFGSTLVTAFRERSDVLRANNTNIGNLSWGGLTNFGGPQATFDGVDTNKGANDGAAVGAIGEFSSPSANGNARVPWGATILGLAVVSLVVTAMMVLRRSREARRERGLRLDEFSSSAQSKADLSRRGVQDQYTYDEDLVEDRTREISPRAIEYPMSGSVENDSFEDNDQSTARPDTSAALSLEDELDALASEFPVDSPDDYEKAMGTEVELGAFGRRHIDRASSSIVSVDEGHAYNPYGHSYTIPDTLDL